MKRSEKGQAVSPVIVLIALGCAGVYYGGRALVKGAEKLGHEIAKPFHHHKPKTAPLVVVQP